MILAITKHNCKGSHLGNLRYDFMKDHQIWLLDTNLLVYLAYNATPVQRHPLSANILANINYCSSFKGQHQSQFGSVEGMVSQGLELYLSSW